MKQFKINYTSLVILHVFIGFAIFTFEPLSKFYFAAILAWFFIRILQANKKNRPTEVLIACSYIVGSEVFLRMTGGNFLYEASKYSVIFFLALGIFFDSISRKSYPYLIYILLLVPGIFMASVTLDYGTEFRKVVAFNLSGPVCLGIAALYCYKQKEPFSIYDKITQAIALPIIANTIYLYRYNPNIKDVLNGTQSNFEASGGFGPNQVATVLGLGMFALVVRYIVFSKNGFQKLLNLVLLALVSYRAIITFSRGGIITSLIIVFAFLGLYYLQSSGRLRKQLSLSIVIIVLLSVGVWVFSSFQTLGFIDKRYSNQDASGRVKEDITTGRVELVSSEFQEFFENPFLGIGVGKVKEARLERIGIEAASHNEMSRILAEHGFFGACAFLILLIFPLVYRMKHRNNYLFFSFYLFWFLTINHSSMRIAAPAFIYALCLLDIQNGKPTLHRKQIS